MATYPAPIAPPAPPHSDASPLDQWRAAIGGTGPDPNKLPGNDIAAQTWFDQFKPHESTQGDPS